MVINTGSIVTGILVMMVICLFVSAAQFGGGAAQIWAHLHTASGSA